MKIWPDFGRGRIWYPVQSYYRPQTETSYTLSIVNAPRSVATECNSVLSSFI